MYPRTAEFGLPVTTTGAAEKRKQGVVDAGDGERVLRRRWLIVAGATGSLAGRPPPEVYLPEN